MDPLLRSIADRPGIVLLLVGLLSLGLGAQLWDFSAGAPRIRVETAVNRILPDEDEDRRVYDRFRAHFGNDEIILIALVADEIFTFENLRRIQRMTERFEDVEGIRRVVSLSNTPDIRAKDGDVVIEPMLNTMPEDAAALAALKTHMLANPVHVGSLISRDARAASFLIYPREMSEREFRDRGIDTELMRIADEEAGDDARALLSGAPPLKAATSRLILTDLLRIMPLQYVFMAIVAWFTFRSWRSALVPLATIGLAQLWTISSVAASGSSLNLVTYIVPPLVMSIGFAYSVHVVSEHAEAVDARGEPSPEATLEALRSVAFPVFLTALTTAAGFLSLMTSTIPAIREFGLFCVIGVLSAMLASLTFAPAVLTLIPPPRSARAGSGEGRIESLAGQLGAWNLRHRLPILLAGAGVFAAALVGLTRIEVSTSLLENLKPDHPIREDAAVFNEHLDGTAQIYVMIEAERNAFKEPANVQILRDLQDWLEQQPEVGGAISLADYLQVVNRAFHDGDEAYFSIPATRSLISQFLFFVWNDQLEHFIDKRFQAAAIHLRVPSYGTSVYNDLILRIEERLRTLPAHLSSHVTGNTVLVVRTLDDITRGQALSLSAALLIIYGILAVYFRSPIVGLYALVPNALPVIGYFGLLGWSGVTLNIITSLIACIILGIAVDDTIHFLVRYKEHRAKTGDRDKGVVLALQSVARPVTSTSVALALGFLVLAMSSLRHQVEFGWMAAVMLAFAWLVDVTFTPALASRMPFRRGSGASA